ncbi:MAG: helix-turn-helix domain-containing protein [Actinomycetota bacterium]|nr:helix-turn-helix domain-containing protein [Actinomycetota bacterium]MDA2950023.1 helix-turn-helix domain-containing protein [Actinomycetota bacterium]
MVNHRLSCCPPQGDYSTAGTHGAGELVATIAKALAVSRATVYRVLAEYLSVAPAIFGLDQRGI